jgi:Gpi18-like mannosyltransferase
LSKDILFSRFFFYLQNKFNLQYYFTNIVELSQYIIAIYQDKDMKKIKNILKQYKNQQKTVPNIQKLRYNIFEMDQKKK